MVVTDAGNELKSWFKHQERNRLSEEHYFLTVFLLLLTSAM